MRGLSIALVIALSGCATNGGITGAFNCDNADKVKAVASATLNALDKFCPIKPPPESEAKNVLQL